MKYIFRVACYWILPYNSFSYLQLLFWYINAFLASNVYFFPFLILLGTLSAHSLFANMSYVYITIMYVFEVLFSYIHWNTNYPDYKVSIFRIPLTQIVYYHRPRLPNSHLSHAWTSLSYQTFCPILKLNQYN
jgi:hypothetical protein